MPWSTSKSIPWAPSNKIFFPDNLNWSIFFHTGWENWSIWGANFSKSSNTVAASAATGTGCGPNSIDYVLGITKAYTTRVGEGPFPTELKDNIGELLGTRGKEFGTVTSRKRRCGWFDGVLVRQTIKVSGIDGIALTKLDVLDELDQIKICVAYEING